MDVLNVCHSAQCWASFAHRKAAGVALLGSGVWTSARLRGVQLPPWPEHEHYDPKEKAGAPVVNGTGKHGRIVVLGPGGEVLCIAGSPAAGAAMLVLQ